MYLVESCQQYRGVERLNLILSQPITAAYKHADGKKIDGRRVLVDVERGRTVKGWLPRRLGESERQLGRDEPYVGHICRRRSGQHTEGRGRCEHPSLRQRRQRS